MSLVRSETRRALKRRAVRVLIVLALVGCGVAGVISYGGSAGKTEHELRLDDEGNPAVMTDWWDASTHEGFLAVAMFFLFLGAFFGGATFAGGEWRAGTVATTLTWEPRRIRLHVARTTSAAGLAFVISFALQVVFLASFLPAVALNGTAAGADGEFWIGLVVAMARTSAISAIAAATAVALATVARNTAFAVIALFTWLIVIEGMVRALAPRFAPWLLGENLGTVMTWSQLDTASFDRGPLTAGATLVLYSALLVGVGTLTFQRRDIAAAT